MENTVFLVFFMLAFIIQRAMAVNYVTNGGFELPAVPSGTDILEGAVGWNGSTYQVMNRYRTLGHQQFIDLQGIQGVNGYIEQLITLPVSGSYNLSFLQQANTTNYLSYIMDVIWNGQLITTQIGTTTQTTYQQFTVCGVQGSNLLKFKERGTTGDWTGMYLDEVSLSQFSSTQTTANLCPQLNNQTTPTNTTTNTTNTTTTTNVSSSNTSALSNGTNGTSAINSTNGTAGATGSNGTNSTSNISSTNGTSNLTNPQNTSSLSNTTNATTPINTTNTTNVSNISNATNLSYFSSSIISNNLTNQIPSVLQNNLGQGTEEDYLKYIIACIFSTYFNQASGPRYAYLFAEDLWLYNYDKKQHEGIISIIFNITATIELMKFDVLDRVLHWSKYNDHLPVSDYLPYTRERFIKIESSSSVLIKAVFPFFIYTIPQNVLVYVLLYLLFLLFINYRMSQYLRKYYFVRVVLYQALIEGNTIYFTYVCFGHLSTSFNFQFGDKASLTFTVLFMYIVIIFTFVFYPIIGHLLGKKVAYFIYYCYRCNPGYFFLAMKNLVRNFLRGATFYFLHQFFGMEMVMLSVIEVLVIGVTIALQSKKQIFISKILYCLWLLYHFLFILLNLSLFMVQASETIFYDLNLKQLSLDMQTVIIYLLIGNTIMAILIDFMPLSWLKPGQKLYAGYDLNLTKQENSKWKKFIKQVEQRKKTKDSTHINKRKIKSNIKPKHQFKLKGANKASEIPVSGPNQNQIRFQTLQNFKKLKVSDQKTSATPSRKPEKARQKTKIKKSQKKLQSRSKNVAKLEVKLKIVKKSYQKKLSYG